MLCCAIRAAARSVQAQQRRHAAHVHVGGHAPEPGERDDTGTLRWSWRATELSDGLIETPRLLEELHRVDYRGFITVEDFRTDLPPEQKFATAIQYLRRVEPSS